jgi:hypothetical protein
VLDGERNQLIPQHRRREVLPTQLAYTRLRGVPNSILKDHSCPSLWPGQPAGSDRSLTERGALDAAWTARVSCCAL